MSSDELVGFENGSMIDFERRPPYASPGEKNVAFEQGVLSLKQGLRLNPEGEKITSEWDNLLSRFKGTPLDNENFGQIPVETYLPRSGQTVTPDQVLDAFMEVGGNVEGGARGPEVMQMLTRRQPVGIIDISRKNKKLKSGRPRWKEPSDAPPPDQLYDIPGAPLGKGKFVGHMLPSDNSEDLMPMFNPEPFELSGPPPKMPGTRTKASARKAANQANASYISQNFVSQGLMDAMASPHVNNK
nr:hypothetical protein [Sicyoidochytrium minutum DNA virus]